jgi:hypothetical protein
MNATADIQTELGTKSARERLRSAKLSARTLSIIREAALVLNDLE